MLTARDSLDNKLAGFDSGADDYLVKPFALQEVEVRLNALSRRGRGVQARVLEVADLEYNLDTLEVRRGGKLLQLSPTALKILQALMEASPAVVTRQELETRVWGEELPDSDSLRVHIHRSEEHTSELQSLMRSSYAVFCLKKKITMRQ